MVKCLIDNKEFPNGGVMARHIKDTHEMTYKEYYHKYILKTDDPPRCKCGCGSIPRWTGMGYKDFLKGHYSRVHNNWGNNPKAISHSIETRRKRFASGEITTWNKGLSKETDKRVKQNGMKSSKGIRTNTEEIRRRSAAMKKNRLNGVIPTLYGSDHSQWIDGRSKINVLAYNDRRLYKQWKYPILVRDGFKCVECGEGKKLHIHHDKEKMCDIVKNHLAETTEEMLEDFKIKRMIADAVVDYHIKNKVSGITLCSDCHEKYHPSLNFV
jgi:hypothetical protein